MPKRWKIPFQDRILGVLHAVRDRADLLIHVLAPERLEPVIQALPPPPPPIVVVSAKDSYYVEIIGKRLRIDCLTFRVWIDPGLKEVFVEGYPVLIRIHFDGRRLSFTSEKSGLRFDRSPRQIFEVNAKIDFDPTAAEVRWNDLRVLINREEPSVSIWNATVLTQFGNRLTGIGPDLPVPPHFAKLVAAIADESGEADTPEEPESKVVPFSTVH